MPRWISTHTLFSRPDRLNTRRSLCAFTLMELIVVIVILAAISAVVVSQVDGTRDDAERITAQATLQSVQEALMGSPAGPGYLADMKFVPGFVAVDVRPRDLLSPSRYPQFGSFDPVARRGWRGPYLRNTRGVANTNTARNGTFPASDEQRFMNDRTFLERNFFTDAATSPYGETGQLTVADPWGNPIVLQFPADTELTDAQRFHYARLVSAGADGEIQTPRDLLAGMEINGPEHRRGDDFVVFLNRADVYENEAP